MGSLAAIMNDNAGIAAWVQTFGALLALGVAIWIPTRQAKAAQAERLQLLRREQQEREQATQDRVEKLFAIGFFAQQQLKELLDVFEKRPPDQIRSYLKTSHSGEALRALIGSVNEIPIFDLPNAAFVTLGLQMREICNRGVEQVELAIERLGKCEMSTWYDTLDRIGEAVAELGGITQTLIDVREEMATEIADKS